MNNILIIVLLLCISCSQGARLLGIFPMPGGSHYILASKLMKGFAAAGHHVTMITPYPTKDVPKNSSWDDIVLEGLADNYVENFKKINIFEDSRRSGVERTISYQNLMMDWVNSTLYHPKVRALLTKETKFDAVIMEQFYNDAHKYFAHYFKCPLILMSSMGPVPWVSDIVGNPMPPAYVPHFFNAGDFLIDSFRDRFFNLFDYIFEFALDNLYLRPLQNRLLQQAFPGAPSIDQLDNEHSSIVLLNSHESLLEAVPLVPNMVEVGGYHIDPPERLPKDIQEFLDNAKNGAIFFSMGSNIKAREMSAAKRQMLLNVFKKLKQRVLWKFEDENAPGMPDNLMVKSWMPQTDILAHPNLKLFITHGGFLSTTETVYHGVPVLAIPVFADQFMNSNKMVKYGFGLKLPYNDPNFNEGNLTQLLQELLTNGKYKENAKKRSRIFHDRPLQPMQNAVYWLEYVIRHNGTKHLKVSGVDLPIYKYLMLDVVACIFLAVVSVVYIVKLIILRIILKNKLPNKQKTH